MMRPWVGCDGDKEMKWLWRGGEGPQEMPQWAYRHLVVVLKADPDRVSLLKCTEQIDFLENRPVHVIRIFDPTRAQQGEIKDFSSLDRYPNLILYEGHMDMESGEITICPVNESAA